MWKRWSQAYTVIYIRLGTSGIVISDTVFSFANIAKPSWIFRYFLHVGFPRRDLLHPTKELRRVTADVSLYSRVMLHTLFVNIRCFNPLNPELNPICYLLALLGAHHFLRVSRLGVKLLTFRLLMSYIYGAPILDVSRSHTTTRHSR